MTDEICGTCKYWKEEGDQSEGRCFLNPSIHIAGGGWFNPVMNKYEFCSHWRSTIVYVPVEEPIVEAVAAVENPDMVSKREVLSKLRSRRNAYKENSTSWYAVDQAIRDIERI